MILHPPRIHVPLEYAVLVWNPKSDRIYLTSSQDDLARFDELYGPFTHKLGDSRAWLPTQLGLDTPANQPHWWRWASNPHRLIYALEALVRLVDEDNVDEYAARHTFALIPEWRQAFPTSKHLDDAMRDRRLELEIIQRHEFIAYGTIPRLCRHYASRSAPKTCALCGDTIR